MQGPSSINEIIFGSASARESTAISRDVRAGRLRHLAPKLYTANLTDPAEGIIRRHLYRILSHYYPKAVVSHRSALEGGISRDDTVFLTYKYTKRVSLPGITIHILQGQGPVEGDSPIMDGLFLASRTRAVLENLQPARARTTSAQYWSREEIEKYLDEIVRAQGEAELVRLCDHAWRIASTLNLGAEYEALDALISGILAGRAASLVPEAMRSPTADAPYDAHRLALFTTLYTALHKAELPVRPMPTLTPEGLRNLAFFEAYFSNYIEGPEFMVEAAADIVFRGRRLPPRPADAHDILGTYQVVSNRQEMVRVPASADEFIAILKSRHALLLAGHPEQQPGRFKQQENWAGETVFVAPGLVVGTLIKGIEPYLALDDPFSRAIYMMFLVAEVHPYANGNERMARVMMNAELTHSERCPIIIPAVYQAEYQLALQALTHQGDADPYIQMLDRAQEYTAQIDFNDYEMARAQFRESGAFLRSSEGTWLRPCEVFWD